MFVIENNGYAYSTPAREQFAAGTELWRRAAGYGIEGFALDCTGDVREVARTLAATIDKVRTTGRPVLIEAQVLRLRGHAAYDTCDYIEQFYGPEQGYVYTHASLPLVRGALERSKTYIWEKISLVHWHTGSEL